MVTLIELLKSVVDGPHKNLSQVKPLSSILNPILARVDYVKLLKFEEERYIRMMTNPKLGHTSRTRFHQMNVLTFISVTRGTAYSHNGKVVEVNPSDFYNADGTTVSLTERLCTDRNSFKSNVVTGAIPKILNMENLPVFSERTYPGGSMRQLIDVPITTSQLDCVSYNRNEIEELFATCGKIVSQEYKWVPRLWGTNFTLSFLMAPLSEVEREKYYQPFRDMCFSLRRIRKISPIDQGKERTGKTYIGNLIDEVLEANIGDMPILSFRPGMVFGNSPVLPNVPVDEYDIPRIVYLEEIHKEWVKYQSCIKGARCSIQPPSAINIEEIESELYRLLNY